MAKDTIVTRSKLDAIADAINEKTGGTSSMTLDEMVDEIAAIGTGGGASDAVLAALLNRSASGALEIPADIGATQIGSMAFQRVMGGYTLEVPEGITDIGNYAFRYAGIAGILLPESLQTIGTEAFSSCSLLEVVDIPSTAALTSIGASAFLTSSIKTITIPAAVTSIGSTCFGSVSTLTDIYCYPTTPPALADTYAIQNRTSLTIHVPAGCLAAYKSATNWAALTAVTWKEDL